MPQFDFSTFLTQNLQLFFFYAVFFYELYFFTRLFSDRLQLESHYKKQLLSYLRLQKLKKKYNVKLYTLVTALKKK